MYADAAEQPRLYPEAAAALDIAARLNSANRNEGNSVSFKSLSLHRSVLHSPVRAVLTRQTYFTIMSVQPCVFSNRKRRCIHSDTVHHSAHTFSSRLYPRKQLGGIALNVCVTWCGMAKSSHMPILHLAVTCCGLSWCLHHPHVNSCMQGEKYPLFFPIGSTLTLEACARVACMHMGEHQSLYCMLLCVVVGTIGRNIG